MYPYNVARISIPARSLLKYNLIHLDLSKCNRALNAIYNGETKNHISKERYTKFSVEII